MAKVTITPLAYKTLCMVSAWPEKLGRVAEHIEATCGLAPPARPNQFSESNGRIVACLAPGRFLLLSQDEAFSSQITGQDHSDILTIVQLDHSREIFRMEGEQASRLLMKGVAIDLDENAFPVGSLFQSSIHDIAVIALRRGPHQFDVLAYKSYAASLRHWLDDAALEFS